MEKVQFLISFWNCTSDAMYKIINAMSLDIEIQKVTTLQEAVTLPSFVGRCLEICQELHHQNGAIVFEAEKQFFLTIMQGNEMLKNCTPSSAAIAFLEAMSMGLSFNPISKHCYIMPYNRKQGNGWVSEVKLDVSAYGRAAMLQAHNVITGFDEPILVYSCDEFQIVDNKPVHVRKMPSESDKIIGGYICIHKQNLQPNFVFYNGLDFLNWRKEANKKVRKGKDETLEQYNERLKQVEEKYQIAGFIKTKIVRHAINRIPLPIYGLRPSLNATSIQEIDDESLPIEVQ